MSEDEWERGRSPISPNERGRRGAAARQSAVAEYTALEFPWESVAWVVNSQAHPKPAGRAKGRSKNERSAKEPADLFWGV